MTTPTVSSAAVTERMTPAHTASRVTAAWNARSAAAVPDGVWVPAVSGLLIVTAGAMSLATRQPWLFAGLGPTALVVASSPGHATVRFHSIVLGHATAFACAWLALLLLGTENTPTLLGGHALTVARVWASALAVAAAALVQPTLRAYHPPAAATALLVTLGAYPTTWKTALSMLGGVMVVALLGEWFQRVRITERRAGRIAA